jgi:hypothetical protein
MRNETHRIRRNKMTYVICGLDGKFDNFNAIKEKANITEKDMIYVIGGIAGDGLELLSEMSMMSNVYPVVSASDYKALRMLGGFDKMLKSGETPSESYIADMQSWMLEGGKEMLDAFRELDDEMREGTIDYLGDFALFEEASVGNKDFIILPRGLEEMDTDADLYDLEPASFMATPLDMSKEYFGGKITITADAEGDYGKITRIGNNVCLGCGKTVALRLDDMAEFYA